MQASIPHRTLVLLRPLIKSGVKLSFLEFIEGLKDIVNVS
jgi:hypothetical protein